MTGNSFKAEWCCPSMQNSITIDELENRLDFFHKMYDVVRIVDPVNKQVLKYKDAAYSAADHFCYAYWGDQANICDNCISIRAYRQNKSFVKLEQKETVIMLVTAIPVDTTEKPVVAELLKNATDSMLIGPGDYVKGRLVNDIILEFNQMAVTDSLTSLYNRRYIDERLPGDIAASVILEHPLSVIFIDVDGMKYINDTYGHTAGDYVLQKVGEAITAGLSEHNGWAARYGGDEFLVCLSNVSYDEADKISKRISENIDMVSPLPELKDFRISASAGVYTSDGLQLTVSEIIHLADQKMYQAKKNKLGKNRNLNRGLPENTGL